MKNRIAIINYKFVKDYFTELCNLCQKNEIEVDLIALVENSEYENLANRVIKISQDEKIPVEERIKNAINIDDYDFILSDCLQLPFTCNVVHNPSKAERMALAENFIYRKMLQLGHQKQINKEKAIFQSCPRIIAVSNAVKRDFSKNYSINPDKIIVAHPGTNTKELEPPSTTSERNTPFTIGIVTCGFTTKGGYNLLGALNILKHKYSNKEIKAKIINPKIRKQWFLRLYLKLTGLDKYVEFLPFQKDINQFYTSLDCLVCASRYEAFGRVVTEAMLCEKVVIAGSNIGAAEIIKEGENGFIFDAKSPHKNLAQKLDQLISSTEDFTNLKKEARKTALNLTWANFAKEIFYGLYKELKN